MRMNEWTNQQMNEIEYVFFNWFTFIEHLFDCSCICLWPILILIRSKFNLLEYNWANRVFSLALLYLSLSLFLLSLRECNILRETIANI